MAKRQGTNIAAPVTTYTDEDIYCTHYALLGHGGWRNVADIATRDSLLPSMWDLHMIVSTASNGKKWELISIPAVGESLTPANWKELGTGREILVPIDKEINSCDYFVLVNEIIYASELGRIASILIHAYNTENGAETTIRIVENETAQVIASASLETKETTVVTQLAITGQPGNTGLLQLEIKSTNQVYVKSILIIY